MRRLVCLGLLVGLGPWCARGSAAQSPPAVSVSVDHCVPVDHDKLHTLLAIELGTSTAPGAANAAATHVGVGCTARGIELRLEDAVTRKQMSRTLPAGSFADASSTRLLALAIAEFVVASWIELSVQPEPVVEPVGPRADPALRRKAQSVVAQKVPAPENARRPAERTLSAGPAVQLWSSHDAVLFGAGLRVLLPLSGAIVWTLSGDVAASRTDVAFGNLDVITASTALAIALQLRAGDLAFQLGPGGRLGFTRMEGEPADPRRGRGDDFVALYGGPVWLSRMELRASERLRLGLELEAGLATIPVRAETDDDRAVLDLRGVWFTSAVCVGFAF